MKIVIMFLLLSAHAKAGGVRLLESNGVTFVIKKTYSLGTTIDTDKNKCIAVTSLDKTAIEFFCTNKSDKRYMRMYIPCDGVTNGSLRMEVPHGDVQHGDNALQDIFIVTCD